MRRVYHPGKGKKEKPENRKRIEKDALCILRQTREMIAPELLTSMREAIAKALPDPVFTIKDPEIEAVDRQKNLTIVMKYIQANPNNKAVMQELQSLLSDDF